MVPERSTRRVRRRRRTPRLLRALAATAAILLAIGAIGYVGSELRSRAPTATTSTAGSAATTRTSGRSAAVTHPRVTTLRVQARRVGTLTSALQDAAAARASASGGSVALLAGLSASDLSTNLIRVANSRRDSGDRHAAAGAARRRCRLRGWGRLPVRWRRRDLPARGDLPRRREQRRRRSRCRPSGGELGPAGHEHRRHGLHRRRLHGQPVARHDRRVSSAGLGDGWWRTCRPRFATRRSPPSAAT